MADQLREGYRERGLTRRPGWAAVLAAGVALALGSALWLLPGDGAPLPAVARQALVVALPDWHLTEPVNEIVYGTRGFDTFGETFLLMAAVVGIVVLTRDREHRTERLGEQDAAAREQRETDPDGAGRHRDDTGGERAARSAERSERRGGGRAMTVVTRGGVRTVAPLLAVAGCYLVAWGYAPGGGFPGGGVLLGVVLLLYAAYGLRPLRPVLAQERVEAVELTGALLVCALAAGGLVAAGAVLANWLPLAPPQTIRSGGTAQAFSVLELVEVATGLTIAVFALLRTRHQWAPDPSGDEGGRP
jgi:multicomponent Na+:H+ antiporter subunit B